MLSTCACNAVKSQGDAVNTLSGRSLATLTCMRATCERHGQPYCALGTHASHCAPWRTLPIPSDIADSLVALSLLIVSVASHLRDLLIMAFRRNFRAGRMVYHVLLNLL